MSWVFGRRWPRAQAIGQREITALPKLRRRLTIFPSAPTSLASDSIGAVIPVIAIEPGGDLGGLVGEAVLRPAGNGFLDTDDIGLGHRVGDAGHVVLAVGADAVVSVGTEKHK